MKFSTVEIIPSGHKRDKWEVRFTDLTGDRVNERHGPNGLGFYHYPRRIGKAKAFEMLRGHLIAKHEEKIAELTKSLGKLKALKMPNDQAETSERSDDSSPAPCSVSLWDCPCGYSYHSGISRCLKCGRNKPNSELCVKVKSEQQMKGEK